MTVSRWSGKDRARLLVMLAGAFLVVLDFFIVLVALPAISKDLGATSGQLQLIVAGYGVANAAGLIAGGKLGDLFGRREMFLVGALLFGAASVGCAVSETALMLVLMRFAQGAAGALLHPQVLALLGLTFPAEKRPKAFAAYAIAMGLAGVTGQLFGGALIEADLAGTGWRACFLINVPIVIAAVIAGALLLKNDAPARKPGARLDAGSALLASAALTCLILPLTYGREALPMWVNATLFVAAVMLAAWFVFNQRWRAARGLTPMIPPAVMAIPSFTLGVGTVLVFYVSVASFYFVLGLYLQTTHGWSALQSGLVFAALGAAFLTTSLLGPRLQRTLPRPLVECGALVLVAGHLVQAMAAWLGAPAALAAVALLIEGVGLGLVMAPLVSLALAQVPREHAGIGAGILSTMQSTGNALGVATVALFYVAGTGGHLAGSQLDFARSLVGLALINFVVWRMACALRARPA